MSQGLPYIIDDRFRKRKPKNAPRCYICNESGGKMVDNQEVNQEGKGFGRHNWMHLECLVRAKEVVDDITNTSFEKLIFREGYRPKPLKNV